MLNTIEMNPIISLGLIICAVMLIFVMYEQNFTRVFLRSIMGIAIVLGINTQLPEVYSISLNWITVLAIIILGWRGILLLYLGQWLWTMWG